MNQRIVFLKNFDFCMRKKCLFILKAIVKKILSMMKISKGRGGNILSTTKQRKKKQKMMPQVEDIWRERKSVKEDYQ